FAFRKLYFDAWWPNPALIKAGGFDLVEGAQYLRDVAVDAGVLPLALFLAGAGLVARRALREGADVALLVTALGAAQLAFLVASGGDWMVGARFLAPIIPALALTGFVALEALATPPHHPAPLVPLYFSLTP